MGLPFALAVFGPQGQPPQLNKFSLFVEFLGHFLNGIAGERVRSGIPVAVSVEPSVIQCRPLNAKFFQFGNGPQHLRRGDIELVSPSTPAHVVSFVRGLGDLPTFFLQHA